jgi:hypothetical protein
MVGHSLSLGRNDSDGGHCVLFKTEHLRRENNAGDPERIALLVQDNAEKRAVHF